MAYRLAVEGIWLLAEGLLEANTSIALWHHRGSLGSEDSGFDYLIQGNKEGGSPEALGGAGAGGPWGYRGATALARRHAIRTFRLYRTMAEARAVI